MVSVLAAFDDGVGGLGAAGGADVVLVLGPVRADLRVAEAPLAIVVERQRAALEFGGPPRTFVLLFQCSIDEGLLHAVAGFQRQFLRVAEFPLQQRVDIAVLLAGIGIAVAAAIGPVGITAHAVGADAQAEALAERAGERSADLLGVAALVVARSRVAVGGTAVPVITDAFGDDVDHAAHGVGAIQRRHRPAHHFDALDLVRRNPVQVLASEVGAVVGRGRAAHALAVHQHQRVVGRHAAQLDLGLLAGGAEAAGHAGHPAEQGGQVVYRLALDVLAADHADAGRGILDPLLVAGGGDHHGVQILGGRIGGGPGGGHAGQGKQAGGGNGDGQAAARGMRGTGTE
ncbi:hypothetical protein G6F31_014969 [Rhizopus arrhizus]|nr:hypothetical protein G6F31_014969 [Rhizopus arrhizus]